MYNLSEKPYYMNGDNTSENNLNTKKIENSDNNKRIGIYNDENSCYMYIN